MEEAAGVFMAAEKAVKWSQCKIKELQPPSSNVAPAPSSGSVTTKLLKLTLLSSSGEYTQWVSFWDQFTTSDESKDDMANVQRPSYLKLSMEADAASVQLCSRNSFPTNYKEGVKCRAAKVNGIDEHVQALEALMLPVDQWDAILVY